MSDALEADLDIASELDAMEERARFALESPIPTRWCSVLEGRIVAETINDNIAALLFSGELVTREEVAFEAPELLEAWDATERLYLAGVKPDESCFVDVVCDPSIGADVARVIVELVGGTARTRDEMLTDAARPGLAEALGAWDAGDDSTRRGIADEMGAQGSRRSSPTVEPGSVGGCSPSPADRPRFPPSPDPLVGSLSPEQAMDLVRGEVLFDLVDETATLACDGAAGAEPLPPVESAALRREEDLDRFTTTDRDVAPVAGLFPPIRGRLLSENAHAARISERTMSSITLTVFPRASIAAEAEVAAVATAVCRTDALSASPGRCLAATRGGGL